MKDKRRTGRPRKVRNTAMWIGLSLFLVVGGFWIYSRVIMRQVPISVFGVLEELGYTPNAGFSGVFSPGNVIQIKEPGPNGQERSLKTPVVFLWNSDCFPGVAPRVDPFVLPQTRGTSTASLSLNAEALAKFVPTLRIDSSSTVDYVMKIENPRVHTLAKGNLSGRFAEKCVQAFDRQIKAGDKPEWFVVILDAIVAQELDFEINWRADTSTEARSKATKEAESALSQVLEAAKPNIEAPAPIVRLKSEDKEQTVIAAQGPVIIGYRARPLQRQLDE